MSDLENKNEDDEIITIHIDDSEERLKFEKSWERVKATIEEVKKQRKAEKEANEKVEQ